MQKWKTKNGYIIFQVLSGRSNSYLISSDKINILVDTGKKLSCKLLQKNIDSLNLNRTITSLILTHTHYDHCQNTFTIKEHEKCEIVMSEKEARYAEQGFTTLPKGTFPISQLISRLGNKIGAKSFGYKPFTPDILVNEEFDFKPNNMNIKIISTSGHSKGSISIIVDNEIAIVGDAMIGVYKNSIFPPFADDKEEMIISWGKLLKTGCNIFLPGHGKEISRELLQNEYTLYSQKLNIHSVEYYPKP